MEFGDQVLSSFSALTGGPSWISRSKLGKFEGRVSTAQSKVMNEDCDILSRSNHTFPFLLCSLLYPLT